MPLVARKLFVLKLINFMCTELSLFPACFGVGCSLRTSEEANSNLGHGLLETSVPGHGLCRSQTAVSGWAECFGHCASGSSYSHGKLLKILFCLRLFLGFYDTDVTPHWKRCFKQGPT